MDHFDGQMKLELREWAENGDAECPLLRHTAQLLLLLLLYCRARSRRRPAGRQLAPVLAGALLAKLIYGQWTAMDGQAL